MMRKPKLVKQKKQNCSLKGCKRPPRHTIGYFRDNKYWCDLQCYKAGI